MAGITDVAEICILLILCLVYGMLQNLWNYGYIDVKYGGSVVSMLDLIKRLHFQLTVRA